MSKKTRSYNVIGCFNRNLSIFNVHLKLSLGAFWHKDMFVFFKSASNSRFLPTHCRILGEFCVFSGNFRGFSGGRF
jgi:hypothetical protein